MRVDRRLFPIKLHYFLRFMGTGPLTVILSVITRQMGVPDKVVGDIWAVLPFISMVAKTSAGAIADATRGHRAVFLGGLILMVSSLTALYWVPDMPNSPSSSPTNSSNPDILSSTSTLPPFPITSTAHNVFFSSNFSTSPLVSSHPSVTLASDQPPAEVDEGVTATPVPASAPDPKGGDIGRLLSTYEFWVLFLCLLGQYCGHVTVITMQETVCFQLLGEERHKYGQQRVWGTVGIGLSAIISGALVDLYSKWIGRKDYLPAHILTAAFLVADIFLVARLKFPQPERRKGSSDLQALWRPHVVLVLVSTGVVGVVSGVIWTFEFILVIDVATEWDQGFSHQRLLLGLLTGVQCFLAEVPFFILAGRIIQWLGHANALFFSLLGFTLRLILYSFVYNPWCFVPIDILHGVSFAVAYPCFTSYASTVAPKGSEATTQAIFGATFFGSTGVGGLVGGRLFAAVGGRQTFLLMGVGTCVYSILFFLVHWVINRLTRSTDVPEGRLDGCLDGSCVDFGHSAKEENYQRTTARLDLVSPRSSSPRVDRSATTAASRLPAPSPGL
ncbi:major facilitator superfamily domain-containing protein 6-like isoform X2 [Eriocheir sinensis]|uniref:major facilitator superfamily domain-containing protein 6-like isoform X2 n=1 Tax=Eriocheir sinensis TaxID=95602 RepID=UPI0021CA84CA|nr:major facilitator superfamily domain-containing protein 6-like isoform X2 [Eriocheir sinensis]